MGMKEMAGKLLASWTQKDEQGRPLPVEGKNVLVLPPVEIADDHFPSSVAENKRSSGSSIIYART